jgi:hypothetical protein
MKTTSHIIFQNWIQVSLSKLIFSWSSINTASFQIRCRVTCIHNFYYLVWLRKYKIDKKLKSVVIELLVVIRLPMLCIFQPMHSTNICFRSPASILLNLNDYVNWSICMNTSQQLSSKPWFLKHPNKQTNLTYHLHYSMAVRITTDTV